MYARFISLLALCLFWRSMSIAQGIDPRIDQNYLTSSIGLAISEDKQFAVNYCDYGKLEVIHLETFKVVFATDLLCTVHHISFTKNHSLVVVHSELGLGGAGEGLWVSHLQLDGCTTNDIHRICSSSKVSEIVLYGLAVQFNRGRSIMWLSSENAKIAYDILNMKVLVNPPSMSQPSIPITEDISHYFIGNQDIGRSISVSKDSLIHPVHRASWSPDGRYVALACGRPSQFWSVGAGTNEQGYGSIVIIEAETQKIRYQTNALPRQPQFNVIDLLWKDNQSFYAGDVKANVMEFHVDRPYYVRKVDKPNSFPTPLVVDANFSKLLFSNSSTGILHMIDNAYIEDIDTNAYAYLQASPNGSIALAPFDGKRDLATKVRTSTGKWTEFRAFSDVNKMIYDESNGLLIQNMIEKYNYSMSEDTITVTADNIIVNEGTYGVQLQDVSYYDPYFEQGMEHYSVKYAGIVTVDDLFTGKRLHFQLEDGWINHCQYSGNGRYLNLSNIGYKEFDDKGYVSFQENYLFDLVERRFIREINNQAPVLIELDEVNGLGIAVLKDKSMVAWRESTSEVLFELSYDSLVMRAIIDRIVDRDHIVSFNAIQQMVCIGPGMWVNYDGEYVEGPNHLSNLIPANSGKYYTSKFTDQTNGSFYSPTVSIKKLFLGNWDQSIPRLSFEIKEEFGIDKDRKEVFFHKEKELAFVNIGEGIAKLYDLTTNHLLLTIKVIEGSEWLAYTPQGLFDGSSEGRNRLYYTEGAEVILLDQIKSTYWVPGLIDKVINKSYMLSDIRPITSFSLYPTATFQLDKQNGLIQVSLNERNGGIGQVALFIGNKEINPDVNPDRKSTFTINLNDYTKNLYQNNVNKIELVTYNKGNWLQSRPYVIYVLSELQDGQKSGTNANNSFSLASADQAIKSNQKPGLYGLFVGTSNYDDPHLKLAYADSDAKALTEGMKAVSEQMYDIERRHLITLTSNAKDEPRFSSKKNIIAALQTIASEAQPDDIIFIFLSGHGVTIDNDFYYLTHTANNIMNQSPTVRADMTLSALEIKDALRNIASNKQVLVLDACHSGGIAAILEGSSKAAGSSQEKALEFLEDKMGVYILASSEANQKSFETERLQQGVLTFSLLLGLSGEAVKDSVINVVDLLNYSSQKSEEIGKLMNRIQRPVLGIARGGSSFPIGFASAAIEVASLNRPKVTEAMINQFPQGYDPLLLSESISETLAAKAGINQSSKALYVSTVDANTYRLTGTYTEVAGMVQVKAYIIKGQEVVAGPIERSQPRDKIKKLELLLCNDFLNKVDELEQRD